MQSVARTEQSDLVHGSDSSEAESSSESSPSSSDDDSEDTLTVVPADAAVIASLKKGTVDEEFQNVSCPICLDELAVGQHFLQMPCQHFFHQGCLETW